MRWLMPPPLPLASHRIQDESQLLYLLPYSRSLRALAATLLLMLRLRLALLVPVCV